MAEVPKPITAAPQDRTQILPTLAAPLGPIFLRKEAPLRLPVQTKTATGTATGTLGPSREEVAGAVPTEPAAVAVALREGDPAEAEDPAEAARAAVAVRRNLSDDKEI